MLRAKNSAVPPEFLQQGGTLVAITGDPVLPYYISGNLLRGDNQHLDLYAHTKPHTLWKIGSIKTPLQHLLLSKNNINTHNCQ